MFDVLKKQFIDIKRTNNDSFYSSGFACLDLNNYLIFRGE